ncbi:MAG TPA: hypothetical protein VIJ96_07000 [Acidothermaceae bacterium]
MGGAELEIGADVVEPIGEPGGAAEFGSVEVGAEDTTSVVPACFDAQLATINTATQTALSTTTQRRASINAPFPINTWDASQAHTVPSDQRVMATAVA